MSNYEIGAIVGRFQVHELHDGHKQLIEEVISSHKKVIIFLGVSRVLGSKKNPLDFGSRKKMIQMRYPEVVVLPLADCRSDKDWSKNLDGRIKETFPIGKALLYGGRDSFIPHYQGKHDTKEVVQEFFVSGTEIRKNVSEDISNSPEWRAGVIYSTYNRFDVSFQAVDIAPFNEDGTKLLLCRKPAEDKYRFIGGFSDPKDNSLEHSARREFKEETGGNAEIGDLKYVSSHRVDDWRYRSENDKVMTVLYSAKYMFGRLEPSDDISELRWFDVEELNNTKFMETWVVEEHHPLMNSLLSKNVPQLETSK